MLLALRTATLNPYDLHQRGEQPERPSKPGPPVLIIVLDTLRGDALDLDEPAISRTPNLDAFSVARIQVERLPMPPIGAEGNSPPP